MAIIYLMHNIPVTEKADEDLVSKLKVKGPIALRQDSWSM
jgi:hypothetical protein